MSNSTTKPARVAMIFNRLTPDQLVSAGTAAITGIESNPKLTALPVSVADSKWGPVSIWPCPRIFIEMK